MIALQDGFTMRRSLIVEDILLIEPAYKNKYPPIGLMKIAYFHRYIMHDYVRFAKGRLPEGLENKKWDRVYVTTLFTFEWENTKKALQYALSVVKPGGKVFTGGILATLRPEWIAKEFPTVINNTGLLNHEGTLGLKGEECIDTLPLDYGILDDIKDEYKYPAEDAYFTYMTRGCGMNCTFCAVKTLEPTYEPYVSISDSIKRIDKEFGPKRDLLLMDNNVLRSPKFDQIIDEIKALGFEKGATFVNPKTGKTVVRHVDFNQGLDAFLLNEHKAQRLGELDLYREYVQNAADSIDEALEQGILKKGEEKISITVSESERIIKISDNGTGVGANDIYSNLIDIGNSKKRHSNSRGFRGIGRLSGLGYCQKLKFLTSIHGEEKASCIIYDAEKLKYLLSPQVDSRDSIDQVLSSVLTIEEIPERINKHYFSVELYGVVPESDLLNDSEVVPYLQQNLPVPFSRDFVWGSMIKQKLVQMEVELAEYNVELRTDRTVIDICKPYKNKILADRIRKINDSISDINFVPFYSGEKVTAMLWYAETNFLGTVLDKDIKGIRIRQGNILIGDENTLRKCYKEERFNSWMVGELLVFNEDIIPNTRRDDYEKNSAYKELLSQFTEWANEMSRQIRHRSYERSLTQSDKKFLADESVTDVDGVDISLGTELDSYDMDDSDSVANTDLLSKLSLLMDMGKKKTKYNVLNLNSKFTVDQKQTLEHVFDALYAKYTNAKANDIIQTIIDSF